ncbi:MAG TPA: YerC/YecD family TrpR-related protein [Methanocorpusculum sp.]|nr:YerC/YecD family TrpR-related protein [Methanocorpusculum sp.]
MAPDNSVSSNLLLNSLMSLKTAEEFRAFLDDVCTIKEIKDISQRLEVAVRLDDGKNYQEITRETGASTATISRVNRCLHYGSDGYQIVIKRIKNNK